MSHYVTPSEEEVYKLLHERGPTVRFVVGERRGPQGYRRVQEAIDSLLDRGLLIDEVDDEGVWVMVRDYSILVNAEMVCMDCDECFPSSGFSMSGRANISGGRGLCNDCWMARYPRSTCTRCSRPTRARGGLCASCKRNDRARESGSPLLVRDNPGLNLLPADDEPAERSRD